ncbi:hypothetical protein VTN00DRAFT_6801 [Thermoascus crustaceus]|uniref:uncharacterized protein n=1 Tax=Thermoascus crustaceus TaxID=5088 RepID=UPI00374394F9
MNMATIKAIEARSVHQIQSGQVIIDLCSVVKELVENSLDAGATSIEVRFKNNGLDLIEVQDNGSGISPNNYENVALKHYTSKLSTFDDLSSLQTFGFRGEALSSLCALSSFHIVTAQADQAPKATRLDFEFSGKLKKTQIVAGQKGTTASVENLFQRLPVRRRELEKNIKREYGKVLGLLHAYACISTGVRFSVKNTVGKNKNVVVFSTKANPTTKENIANVYGAKTLLALIPLDLELEFEPSATGAKKLMGRELNKILVRGHISKPVFGEGRQTPDRQMFFVNSRPCGLPQIAKAFNEVYKSFNVSQSPFIFADFQMDTNAYDVNVSPDKRTILLHDSGPLIESLKDALTRLFEESDQTVPQSQIFTAKQSVLKQHIKKGPEDPVAPKESSGLEEAPEQEQDSAPAENDETIQERGQARMKSFLDALAGRSARAEVRSIPSSDPMPEKETVEPPSDITTDRRSESVEETPRGMDESSNVVQEEQPARSVDEISGGHTAEEANHPVSGTQTQEQQIPKLSASAPAATPNVIQNAFDRMRPKRPPAEMATITIGDKTVTSMVGSGVPKKRGLESVGLVTGVPRQKRRIHTPSRPNIFGQSLRSFAAPGTQMDEASDEAPDDEGSESEMDDSEGTASGEDGPGSPRSEISSDHRRRSPEREPEKSSPDHVASGDIEMDVEDASAGSEDYVDEEEKKARDEARVQELVREAEENARLPSENNINRSNKLTKGLANRDSTAHLVGTINGSISRIQSQMEILRKNLQSYVMGRSEKLDEEETAFQQDSAEERLSLTVTKDDFAKMRIIGQFNLGFILATRSSEDATSGSKDELFIIDQHASDEKYNFERLQAETVVQNQRLVQPKTLDLTAVEEEVIIENRPALEKNGFLIEVDESGDEPIGRRCKLVSLPLSKEVVFGVRDLEELVVLLSESPSTSTATPGSDAYVPRPSKVRKMFAMRACRSSIMIGKSLTLKQMEKVVRQMGTMDKPWNCPHGRPTMRHLMSLGRWNEWDENARADDEEEEEYGLRSEDDGVGLGVWKRYFRGQAEIDVEDEDEHEEEDEEGEGQDG